MRLLVLSLLMLMIVSPVHAQLELDEAGCQVWTELDLTCGDWQLLAGDEAALCGESGFFTDDDELLISMEFERTYVIASVDLLYWADEGETDNLRVYLPAANPVDTRSPANSGMETAMHTWQGNQAADSIAVGMTNDATGAGVTSVEICVAAPPNVENALQLITQSASESLIGTIAIFVAFITAAALVGAAMAVLT